MTQLKTPPAVLIVAGLDPSGGAGLCADIQAVTAAGAHPMPVATLITAQSLRRVARVVPLDPLLVVEQVLVALEDIQPKAIKLGALGNVEIVRALADVLPPDVPMVLDPVLVATSGDALGEDSLPGAMRKHLIPTATLLTPNEDELQALTVDGDRGQRMQQLMALGAHSVLLTGCPAGDDAMYDHLMDADGPGELFRSARLDGEFHGSGCTLAAFCAAHLAHGKAVGEAVRAAHADVAKALVDALDFGFEVRVPQRRA